jgi:hypothetical protein
LRLTAVDGLFCSHLLGTTLWTSGPCEKLSGDARRCGGVRATGPERASTWRAAHRRARPGFSFDPSRMFSREPRARNGRAGSGLHAGSAFPPPGPPRPRDGRTSPGPEVPPAGSRDPSNTGATAIPSRATLPLPTCRPRDPQRSDRPVDRPLRLGAVAPGVATIRRGNDRGACLHQICGYPPSGHRRALTR